jgi:hypothetical protein
MSANGNISVSAFCGVKDASSGFQNYAASATTGVISHHPLTNIGDQAEYILSGLTYTQSGVVAAQQGDMIVMAEGQLPLAGHQMPKLGSSQANQRLHSRPMAVATLVKLVQIALSFNCRAH